MFAFKTLRFTRFEGLLGTAILAISVLVFLPSIKQNLVDTMKIGPDLNLETKTKAETLAHSIRQFHCETDKWPLFTTQASESNPMLAGTIVKDAKANSGDDITGDKTMPLDQWDNPFLVRYIETNKGDSEEDKSIVVVSKGPNGNLDTEISDLWYQNISQRLMNPGTEEAHLQGDLFGGDDIGFILSHLDLGSNN